MGLFKSIQTAFKNRWNLLGLAGGTALAFISGRPDILLPVVLAAETAYLGLLGTHPKFQKFVAAQEHKSRKEETSTQSMDRMLKTLTSKQRSKFTKLCRRCDHLRGIAKDIRQVDGDGNEPSSLNQFQQSGMDRLMWIYLKLLYTDQQLSRFFDATDGKQIQKEHQRVSDQLATAEKREPGEQRDRVVATLRDHLATCEQRRQNFNKAVENFELIRLEINRLENKINSLCEMTVNRQEPNQITTEVSGVAQSMVKAERTMNELEYITGIHTSHDDEVPDVRRHLNTVSSR